MNADARLAKDWGRKSLSLLSNYIYPIQWPVQTVVPTGSLPALSFLYLSLI